MPRERHPQNWFAERLLLTLSGQKPVHWMLGHTVGPAYEQLLGLVPDLPLRGPVRPRLAECRASTPAPDVLEAHALIAYGSARRALAFRLERGADARWRCAAVEVGPRPAPQEQE
ncbi:Rv3235 family protein [Streptomyces sp. NPDC051940]|uniref:Rv3235 family protein n=1 Tax=Streptomyces sp. NPDC051940 TaxID=3155675 RepID=UPI003449074F